ncbi:hypothetical protein ACS0TY_027079 [Phlomoides rotata]
MLMAVPMSLMSPSLQGLSSGTHVVSLWWLSPSPWDEVSPWRRNWHPFFMLSILPLTMAGTLFGWSPTPSWPSTPSRNVFRLCTGGSRDFGKRLSWFFLTSASPTLTFFGRGIRRLTLLPSFTVMKSGLVVVLILLIAY